MSEIQTQIERRQQRALEEIVRVTNRGSHLLFSPFDVVSISGRTYRVTIRALDERRNTCTCPDYRTNLVGTCKHIEGVLLYLKREYADRLKTFAAQKPMAAQIFLHYAQDITVRVTLPLPRSAEARARLTRYFDADGVLQGAALVQLPALLAELNALPARVRSQTVVDDFSIRASSVRSGISTTAFTISSRATSAELPGARVIQTELVEPGYLSAALAARSAQARELTEPPTQSVPPLSATSAKQLLAIVREAIEAGQKRVAEKGLTSVRNFHFANVCGKIGSTGKEIAL